MPRLGKNKPEQDTLALCQRAATLLTGCGFELRNVSMKSESCYYGWAGKKELIRISAHGGKNKKRRDLRSNVVSRITFNGTNLSDVGVMRLSDEKFIQIVEAAIGRYVLACFNHPNQRNSEPSHE